MMYTINNQPFHKKYLKVTAIIIGSFGPIFSLASYFPVAEPARFTLDILSWPIDGIQNYEASTTRFLSALTGGFLMGWGVCIWCLQKWVYDFAPEGVRKTVLVSLTSWFILDSSGSIASGNPSNAFFNVIILLLAVGPLWKPAKETLN